MLLVGGCVCEIQAAEVSLLSSTTLSSSVGRSLCVCLLPVTLAKSPGTLSCFIPIENKEETVKDIRTNTQMLHAENLSALPSLRL